MNVGILLPQKILTVSTRISISKLIEECNNGGDRAEYLQEMENSDPWFYVPPVNDASHSTIYNNLTAN